MAKEWEVTPQQIERLRKLEMGAMNPSSADRDTLWKLWEDHEKAPAGTARVSAQLKLVEKLDEIARAQFEPSRQAYGQKIEEIRKILTPKQVESITKG
jgi:hypothetical protein